MKRKDYISWDEYFMGVAILASKRSKDTNTQVGACIVDNNNIILSTGYNGFPFGCSDDDYPWCRDGVDTKYNYVVHAELNAILNARGNNLKGARLYVDLSHATSAQRRLFSRALPRWFIFTINMPTAVRQLHQKECCSRQG